MIRIIKSRRMTLAGHVAQMGRRGMNVERNKDRKRPLGRPRRRLMDNLKIDLRELGRDGKNWTDLAQDKGQCRALMNTILNPLVP
jgi:hypothetical protein